MAGSTTTSFKTDAIQTDKMKFHTEMVNGKPQIFFDTIDQPSNKQRSKRPSRTLSNAQTGRLADQQKNKVTNQKFPADSGAAQRASKGQLGSDKVRVNEDGSTLGVYMTMDELSELVKAVKENSKNSNSTNVETKATAPAPPAPPVPHFQEQQRYESVPAPPVPKLDLQSAAHNTSSGQISPREQTLSIMAEKKRQKWMREKAEIERMQMEIEYDQLKHQLSPRHKKNSVSPERSTFQYDFPATAKPPPVPPLPPTIRLNDSQHDIPPKASDDGPMEPAKTRLMEQKQQQWHRENADKMPVWNPFGRPGAGAPNPNEMTARPTPMPTDAGVAYRPPLPPPPPPPQAPPPPPPPQAPPPPPPPQAPPPAQKLDQSAFSSTPTYMHSDQTRVPAAMRTNLLFGDVRFEDDVKTAKEIERRQWLGDLQRQIEENKRKKLGSYETDRRYDFLQENVQPLLQEAANRHQQTKEMSTTQSAPDFNKFNRQEPTARPSFDKTREIDTKSTVPASNQRTGEKLFGPTYETSSKANPSNGAGPSHLSVGIDQQNLYRPADARRNEAVNNVGATFRSDHSEQRASPNRPPHGYAYEDADLPPHAPNHRHQKTHLNRPDKRNSRMRPFEDNNQARRTSMTTYQSSNQPDGMTSQMSGARAYQGPVDSNNRPLWNYKNAAQREYVPNSKRDPHYEKRQRLKHFEQGNFDRIDDVQKKTCYNRWNSDSELQQRQKKSVPGNRVRSTASKPSGFGGNKDESILNLLKGRNRPQENFAYPKTPANQTRAEDDYPANRESSLERYENRPSYAQADEGSETVKDYSPRSHSRNSSPHKELTETNTYDDSQQRAWENTNRPETFAPPVSRQEHILQQLSAIKQNLVRRQRELATTSSGIPV